MAARRELDVWSARKEGTEDQMAESIASAIDGWEHTKGVSGKDRKKFHVTVIVELSRVVANPDQEDSRFIEPS